MNTQPLKMPASANQKTGLYPYKGEGIPAVALFSPDELYRYTLKIVWDDKGQDDPQKGVLFVMLNPSTATHQSSDPTVSRCVAFAREWGYSYLTVCNIFAWRATDPKNMRAQADPVGPDNVDHILKQATQHDKVIVAWGNHGRHRNQGKTVSAALRALNIPLYYLKQNKGDVPQHPLYMPKSLQPILWTV